MKGATAEPWVKTTSPPKRTSIKMMGSNQYFFRTFKNWKNSTTNDMVSSKLIAHWARYGSWLRPLNPIGRGFWVQLELQGIFSHGSHNQCNRRDGSQEKDTHNEGGHDFPYGNTKLEPQLVQWLKERRPDNGNNQKSPAHCQGPISNRTPAKKWPNGNDPKNQTKHNSKTFFGTDFYWGMLRIIAHNY